MKRSRQAAKYILSDFVSAAVAWFLFNWLRYEEMAVYEGATSFANYLSYTPVIKGQLIIPFFWLALYYFSGYYNKWLAKSRLTELFSTFVTVLIGVVFIFFVVVLNDLPRSFHVYYELFFSLFGLQFFMTYIPRLAITQSGIRKIKSRKWATKVLIIGAGGLGAPAAMYLAAAGVGTIGIVDADEVDLSNLQRQIIHGTADVGKAKVKSAKETMNAMNPDVTVNTYREFVTSENIMDLIKDYDFIIDGTDNFPAKFLINDACVMAKKPFSHAGIIRFKGQLMTYVPGEGPCYRCVFKNPPPKDAVPTCKQAGVIGAMGGVIGSLQAMEAIKYLIGVGDLLTGKLLTFDALKMEFHTIKLPKADHKCAICGDHPTITELIDYEQIECPDH